MKTLRTFALCLSLIVAGVLFNTGSAYASGGDAKGGDTSCTTQQSPYGNPIIRCSVLGNNKAENGADVRHWHRHHHHYFSYHRHHHYRSHRRHFHHFHHHHH